ncbi:MAG: hypothetical protein KGL53_16390, partial [Elusimicrobia bacterium]|nr:hypothetical protein [Elusimicrobiota bacterium]
MGVLKEQKSALGPSVILVIILFDVGLVIWGWNLYQRRQERLDDAGLNFARAPQAAPAAVPAASPPSEEEPLSGIDRYVVKETLPAAGAKTAAAPAPAASAPVESQGERRGRREASRLSSGLPKSSGRTGRPEWRR